ncbi:MAG TPA: plasmid pRiA4b ORF-3 family protein [Acidimicrobiales bacterium]|jgi:hypothetical protein|nr:plasmid pRiA4b ORF-3 family protein [Acidimicrobiales bacterium]
MAAEPRRKSAIGLRLSLTKHEPEIWRRLLVPGDIKLSRLHAVLQAAMGWQDHHLHGFEIAGQRFELPDEDGDGDEDAIDEDSVTLSELVEAGSRFQYEYDFGDGWDHEVVVETVEEVPQVLKQAICLDGERACPPEDSGGVGGYAEFLRAIGDPDHPEHRDSLAWVGGTFDPEAFGLAAANAALQRVR